MNLPFSRSAAICAAMLLSVEHASAHFPFVVPDDGAATARIVMSETMETDRRVSIDLLDGATFTLRDRDALETPLSLVKAEHWMTMPLPGSGTRVVHGHLDLGVMRRGEGPAYVLVYHPKTVIGDPFDPTTMLGDSVPVELAAVPTGNGFKIKLLTRGAPAPSRELRVITADGGETDYTTDAQGLTPTIDNPGRYAAWARHWVDESGERDGKAFTQVRHYATLVIEHRSRDAAPANTASAPPSAYPPLPIAVASFGAVACDGWMYVYGGHTATRHDYSTATVSGGFCRLRLDSPTTWEQLEGGDGAQGLNLATWQGKVYRAGGMVPRNAPGDKADNHSVDDAAVFDPSIGSWRPLPPLPRPRSSHDLIAVDGRLYAIGGWWMKGRDGETQWHQGVDVLDLSADDAVWTSIPQPFQRRALTVAALDDRIFVIGGFDDEDQPHLDVDIFDIANGTWSKGPSIPSPEDNGFAPAACVHDGRLCLSVSTGEMYRLSEDGGAWLPFAKTAPRIVHRLVPTASEVLVVGGASGSRMVDLIEAVPMTVAATGATD